MLVIVTLSLNVDLPTATTEPNEPVEDDEPLIYQFEVERKRVEYLKTIHPLPEEHYLCPICQKSKHDLLAERKPEKKYSATFVLDHDHNTGEFRGYICWKCNSALGFFEDKIINVRKALHFLEQYEKGENKT